MFFNVKLKKELEKKKKESFNSSDGLVKETMLLLESNENAEKRALQIAGLDHQIRHVETAKGIEIERTQFEKEYGDSVFTRDEIKDICIKYDLRFLPSNRFRGRLDTQISYKLKEFIEKNPSVGNYSNDFYIIAPSNAFELNDRPAKPFITIDPILVYKLPKEDKYVYVHKWGRDFTILRRLRGMFLESRASMWTFAASFWIVMLSAILGLSFNGFTGMWYQYMNLLWIVPTAYGLAYATLAAMFNDGEDFKNRTTRNMWDSTYKRRRA
ncbi:MAG: hypothetical protein AABY15_03165 [Nanoarchaeota archaeon]